MPLVIRSWSADRLPDGELLEAMSFAGGSTRC
jgi:hypothetical protein